MSRALFVLSVAVATTMPIGIRAQPPSEKPAVFDAVSIKPGSPTAGGRLPGPGPNLQFSPGRVVGRNVTARRIVLAAYHLTPYQLSTGPSWLDSDRFNVEARSEGPADRDRLRQMLQAMLADRFKLVVHRETREMPVYEMKVAKQGPKLLEWKDGEPIPKISGAPAGSGGQGRGGGGASGGGLTDHLSMQAFAESLTSDPHLNRPVVDKTGLQGLYLVSFRWDSDDDFLSAAEEALGLKFQSQRAVLEFLTIDRVEKPSAN